METIIESGAVTHFIGFSGDRHVPKMNVSKEADAEFMRLLERDDPKRYENLVKNMRRAASARTEVADVVSHN